MKRIQRNVLMLYAMLATLLFILSGCGNANVRMGEISFAIELSDPIHSLIETYSVIGNIEANTSAIVQEGIYGQGFTVKDLAPGKWSFTIIAFDGGGIEIGKGTKSLTLAEGQKKELVVLVQSARLERAAVTPVESIQVKTTKIETDSLDSPTITTILPPVDFIAEGGVITKKPLTVKPNSTKLETDKVYDGTLFVRVANPGTLEGVIEGDEVILQARAFYNDKTAGKGFLQ